MKVSTVVNNHIELVLKENHSESSAINSGFAARGDIVFLLDEPGADPYVVHLTALLGRWG